MTKRHRVMIGVLLAVIVLAVVGHFIFRPDRNASLKVIYTGDLQGQITYEAGHYAGYEKIAALAEEASKDGSQVLLLDVGNCLGGSEAAEIDDGKSIISLMNAAGYDAMVPGNMDFIYGSSTLSSLRAEAGFPFLAANLKKADGSNAFETYKILNINSVRIGIIGITTGISKVQTTRDSLTVEDPVTAVENVMKELYGRTDAVIVMAYTGDDAITESLADIDGVSLVIESGALEASSTTTDKGVVITAPGRKGSVVGIASIEISGDKAVIDNSFCKAGIYDSLESNEKVVDALETVNSSRMAAEALQIGSVLMQAGTPEETEDASAGPDETATGNLVADAMLDAAALDGASLAWIPDQSIQGELVSGSVSRGQIDALFDDNLYMVSCKMTGGEIRSALEDSFSGYPEAEDFLQVSGISYTYSAGTVIGSGLSNITVADHDLDDAKTYVVAMTNRLADGLGYTSESSGRVSNYRTIASIVSSYIEKQTGTALQETDETDEAVVETEASKRITITE